ncbi:MAG: DinB family protein [Flavobacteriaceae bacterium]|uniref:DinB family protein n=1 Tax=Flagellimonas sp. SN16 TaxID=3415142 RepID=UPI003C52D28B|nr:DinB family protein [Flavobacteriaceae bacterium]
MRSSELPSSEYNPFYHTYILALDNVGLMEELHHGKQLFLSLLDETPKEKLEYAYAEGKWTLAEVLLHIIDAERVFQYRALRFARNDKTPLPGFDQDVYVPHSNASKRTMEDIKKEYMAVRQSTILLFNSFDDEALQRLGVSSGSPLSVRATGFIISGHQVHHLKIIRERYL